MKIKLLLPLLLFLFSCSENNSKYTITVPNVSMEFIHVYHTDHIDYEDGSISFTPIEDTLHTYTLTGNWTIESNF